MLVLCFINLIYLEWLPEKHERNDSIIMRSYLMSTVFQQPSLDFSIPLSARNDPVSSRIAESKVRRAGLVRGQALELLQAIKRNPGLSTKQLATLANADRHVYGRRASTLWQNGLVIRGESKTQELKFWAILESGL